MTMAKHGNYSMLAGLILAAHIPAFAQTLIDPTPAPRAMDVSQFGVPRDAKFIFCNGEDCPERTTKTMTTPKPAAPAPVALRPPIAAVMPQSIQLPAELLRVKVEPVKKVKKPVVRKKKRPAQLGCGPASTAK